MKCKTCKTQNNLSKDFTRPSGSIVYICSSCNTKRSKKYRGTPNGKVNSRKAVYKSIDKYRYKQNARVLVHTAIKNGELCKPNICENCLIKKEVFGHHENYLKPLDVVWLCRDCHILTHKTII